MIIHRQTEKLFTFGKERGYGYLLSGHKVNIETGHGIGDKYGTLCKEGDTIKMTLDLHEMTVRFKVNDVDYGTAFDSIQEAKYRAAVWLCRQSDTVCIVE